MSSGAESLGGEISTSRNSVNTPEARPKGTFAGGLLWGCGRGKGTHGASGHRPVGGAVDWARPWACTTGQKQSPFRLVRPFREVLIISLPYTNGLCVTSELSVVVLPIGLRRNCFRRIPVFHKLPI